MQNIKLIAIDNLLAYIASAQASQEQIAAYSYTLTAAQLEARKKYYSSHGADASIEYTSDEFTELLTHELEKLAWNVEDSGHVSVLYNERGVVPIVQMTGELQKHLNWRELPTLIHIALAFGYSGAPEVHRLLDFCLSSATSISESSTEFAICPLTVDGNTRLSLTMVFFSLGVRITKWNQLVTPYNVDVEGFNIASRYALLNLEMSAYREIQSSIEAELKDKVEQHIYSADL